MTDAVAPLVMIAASNDHQLYFKAYNDYADLDGDNIADTTYKQTITYYGYFDSFKCYDYNTSNLRFEPKAVTSDKYCVGGNDNYWSGNFLNWISMSRIDTINKVLFGGHRRVDTATDTVLERAYLPHDAHSWAKYYNGDDLDKLTPYSAGAAATNYTLTDADPKKNGITFCNTTDVSGTITKSEEVTDPPLIKVAKGNYLLWAGNERWQCTWGSGALSDNHAASNGNVIVNSGINANASSPSYSIGLGEKNYVARVQACVSSSLLGHEKCKQYPDGNYKPIGLLQAYGDDDQLKFGMVAGSYHKHVSGGTLIKNIRSFKDEVNWSTNGTFALVAPAAGGSQSGVTNNNADGIVNAWSLFRIVGYDHGSGTYMGPQYDDCSWGLSAFADVNGANKCKNWGNPFSEIYFQGIRYFSNAGVTGAYQDNTSVGISGLPTPQNWDNPNPLGASNYCARASIIAFNSSTSSYDNDELDASTPGVGEVWKSGLPGVGTSAVMTNVVGAGEGIDGHSYFVGETNVDNQGDGEDQLCTAKTVSSLGNVGGLCPESPRLRGSYRIAGLAYYAHIKDVRGADLTGGRALEGKQKIDTYAVTNASSTPNINIPHPITGGTTVKLLPACRNTTLSPPGNCTIVDFRIVNQVVNDGTGKGTGKFYVNWEDSEQGGDFDQDMWGTIEYEINGNSNTIEVSTDVHAKSTPYKMAFGYVLNGTTNDGFHAHSGINDFFYTDSNAGNIVGGTCVTACKDTDGPSTASYTLGVATADLLNEPLWYAAKWGGFIDSNGSETPDLYEEWDIEDTEGNPTPDGIPDNYFFATNPQQLEDSLNRVFLKILQRTSSGTAAAVVSNNVRGEGALYQAYYEPQKKDANGQVANWVGTLHGLWLDSYGYLREDNGDATLGDYYDDPVIETYFDDGENRTRVKRWVSTEHDRYLPGNPEIVELSDIKPLWNAREQLNFPSLNDSEIATQRPYGTTAANGRYIKTWIDANLNGVVDTGEFVDFAEASIINTNYHFFALPSLADAQGLVRYLRGVETPGYRSRSVDYNGDGVTEVVRLGDIINSTPTMVAAPAEGFDLLYRDSSYSSFRQKYHNRRNVLYVGANDGMLHAFNAGFFDSSLLQFKTTGKKPDGVTEATAHPLGSELWAYVPMNLQPHLQFLRDPDYTHVYYVDGKPRIFDADIFSVDDTHPNGWGTVLVIGMRFGGLARNGSSLVIDTGGDGLHSDANDKERRSAYMIFDITDPESEPVLLGEITPPDVSLTTVYPAVLTFKDTSANKWFLAFGSGPTNFDTGESNANAKLYLFDLAELTVPGTTISNPTGCSAPTTFNGSAMKIISCDTNNATSFIGTPMVVDWDLDYKADTLYFGTVGGVSSNQGQLMKMSLDNSENPVNWTGPDTVVDVAKPVFAPPTATVDSTDPEKYNQWVFFGTGRLLVDSDKVSTATQSLYGIKEIRPYSCSATSKSYYSASLCAANCTAACTGPSTTTITTADLRDVSDIEVQTNGSLINPPSASISTFTLLKDDILNSKKGWSLDLPPITGTQGVAPATRMLNQQALLGGILFSSVYQPSLDLCASEGLSRLYGLYYGTGTALSETIAFGTSSYTDSSSSEVKTISDRYIDLGFGLATAPAIHSGSGSGPDEVSVFTQLSTGAIIRTEASSEDPVGSGKKAWKER